MQQAASSDPHQTERERHRSVPGPVDRESFFAAQSRHRRATWLISLICLLAILLMGIPLAIITAPLLWLVGLLGADLLHLFLPVPDLFPRVIAEVDRLVHSTSDRMLLIQFLPYAAASLATGSAAFAALWLAVRRLLHRAGPSAILTTLGARPPSKVDPEERQLENVVEEMAIAAGLPLPKVMLLDLDIPNAAMIGRRPETAVLVVSRRLLDDCDRDQTQGVVAHLIGSAGNGDLGISLTLLSVQLSLNLAASLLSASQSRQARRLAASILSASLLPQARAGGGEAALIGELMTARCEEIDEEPGGLSGRIQSLLRLPMLLVAMTFLISRTMFQLFVVGPLLALLWRRRKHLADATAVQLTRNPDGLAGALHRLSEHGGPLPGGGGLAHLFIVGQETARARARDRQREAMADLRKEAAQASPLARIALMGRAYTASRRHAEEMNEETGRAADHPLGPFSLLPGLEDRLQRLARMGAMGEAAGSPAEGRTTPAGLLVLILAIVPFGGMMLLLAYAIVALCTLLGLGASSLIMLLVAALFHFLLASLAGG